MRLRIPELYGDRTPYDIASQSGGRLNESTLYRLGRQRGAVKQVNMTVLKALCDVLNVTPTDLFEYEETEQVVEKPAKRTRKAGRRRA